MRAASQLDQSTVLGFEQALVDVRAAQLTLLVELIDDRLPEEEADSAMRRKPATMDSDSTGEFKFDALDQRRGFAEQIFAWLFVARESENLLCL